MQKMITSIDVGKRTENIFNILLCTCFTYYYQSYQYLHKLQTQIWHNSWLSNLTHIYKNSSGDEIANVNFYAVYPKLPEFAEITKNNASMPFKVIQGHQFWYQSKAHIQFPISD